MNGLRFIAINGSGVHVSLNISQISVLNHRERSITMACGQSFALCPETWERFMQALRDPSYNAA